MALKLSSNLKQRLKISSLAIPFLLFIIYLSSFPLFMPFFALLIGAIIAAALWEYYQIAKTKGLQTLTTLGLASSFVYTFAFFLTTQFAQAALLPFLVLGSALTLAFAYCLRKSSSPFIAVALTIFGLSYLTIPLSFLIGINFFYPLHAAEDGRCWLLYLLATTKMTDTGGFVIGKLFGNRLLAPVISPKKTWEGAIGGLAVGVGTSVCFVWLVHAFFSPAPMTMTWKESVGIGLLLSSLAQFGDLAESLLKRDAGVKDSSHIPGLGGMLDIVDSLVFTVPFLYFYMLIKEIP